MIYSFARNAEGVSNNADEIEKLKAMIRELEEKSLFEEKRVSSNNVNIENLTMNMSMNHKTVVGLQEDRKYS